MRCKQNLKCWGLAVLFVTVGDGAVPCYAHHEIQTVFLGTTTLAVAVALSLMLSSTLNNRDRKSWWAKAATFAFTGPGTLVGTILGVIVHEKVFGVPDAETAFLGQSWLLGDGLPRAVLTAGFGVAGGILASRIGHHIGTKEFQGSALAKATVKLVIVLAIPAAAAVYGLQWAYTDW